MLLGSVQEKYDVWNESETTPKEEHNVLYF